MFNLKRILNRRGICMTSWRFRKMFDPMDHATGIDKKELQAHAAGNEDPFGLRAVIKRGQSSCDNPIQVPSAFEGRLVGCVCEPLQHYVCWMWLEKGEAKRCECGHWFKLKQIEPFFNE